MQNKLLIVDDEQDVREFAANFFKKRKIDVIVASSGEEALKAITNECPKLVLLDIKMEGIDGVETLKRIKEISKQIKVIMLTGKNDEDTQAKTKKLGAFDFIHKPLELQELEKVVLKIFNK